MKRSIYRTVTGVTLSGLAAINLTPPSVTANPAAAAACLIPGVGWVSCTVMGVAAGGLLTVWYAGRQYQVYRDHVRTESGTGGNYNEPGKREVHAVSSPQLCREMAERFKMQGRNIKLVRIARTATPMLRYDCIFEGPDAVEGWFHDRRGGR